MSATPLRGHLAEFGVVNTLISHGRELVESCRQPSGDGPGDVILLAYCGLSTRRSTSWKRAIVADYRRDPVDWRRKVLASAGGSPLRRFWPARQIRRYSQIRSAFRRLVWRDAWAQLDRRQGEIRVEQLQQGTGGPSDGLLRHLDFGTAKAQGRVVRLAGRAQSAQTAQGRYGGVGQQLARIVWRSSPPARAFRTSIYAKA